MTVEDRSQWGRYLGLGLEVATGVVLGLLVGWWLDGYFDTSPWALLIGTMLGLASGMYLLIKAALNMEEKK